MDQLNETPFAFASIAGRAGFPAYSLTLIVKGTFQLVSGQAVRLAAEQLLPTGDEYYPDDEDRLGGCRSAVGLCPVQAQN